MNIYLLRGLIRESEHWGEFPQILKQSFPDSNIYCLEPAGAGQRYQEKSPCNIKDLVESMRGEYLKTKGEVNMIISISLGGMISSCWTHEYPDDFQYSVIMNSSFGNLSPIFKRLQPEALKTIGRVAFIPNKVAREEKIVKLVSNNKSKHEKLTRQWQEITSKRPISSPNAIRQLWAAFRYKVKLDKPKADYLVLAGKGDRLAHYSCSERIANLWNYPIEIHPTAGHSLSEDEPEWVAQKIKTWHEGVSHG